jgi:hypothetical protein
MPTPFETFAADELGRRPSFLTATFCSYDGDPNDIAAPAILTGAPVGTYYQQEIPAQLWQKDFGGDWARVFRSANDMVPDSDAALEIGRNAVAESRASILISNLLFGRQVSFQIETEEADQFSFTNNSYNDPSELASFMLSNLSILGLDDEIIPIVVSDTSIRIERSLPGTGSSLTLNQTTNSDPLITYSIGIGSTTYGEAELPARRWVVDQDLIPAVDNQFSFGLEAAAASPAEVFLWSGAWGDATLELVINDTTPFQLILTGAVTDAATAQLEVQALIVAAGLDTVLASEVVALPAALLVGDTVRIYTLTPGFDQSIYVAKAFDGSTSLYSRPYPGLGVVILGGTDIRGSDAQAAARWRELAVRDLSTEKIKSLTIEGDTSSVLFAEDVGLTNIHGGAIFGHVVNVDGLGTALINRLNDSFLLGSSVFVEDGGLAEINATGGTVLAHVYVGTDASALVHAYYGGEVVATAIAYGLAARAEATAADYATCRGYVEADTGSVSRLTATPQGHVRGVSLAYAEGSSQAVAGVSYYDPSFCDAYVYSEGVASSAIARATGKASHAFGRVSSVGGFAALLEASGTASFVNAYIESVAANASAVASGIGSGAFGYALDADIIASADNGWQLGPGSNTEPMSLQVGTGMRLLQDAPAVPKVGDLWPGIESLIVPSAIEPHVDNTSALGNEFVRWANVLSAKGTFAEKQASGGVESLNIETTGILAGTVGATVGGIAALFAQRGLSIGRALVSGDGYASLLSTDGIAFGVSLTIDGNANVIAYGGGFAHGKAESETPTSSVGILAGQAGANAGGYAYAITGVASIQAHVEGSVARGIAYSFDSGGAEVSSMFGDAPFATGAAISESSFNAVVRATGSAAFASASSYAPVGALGDATVEASGRGAVATGSANSLNGAAGIAASGEGSHAGGAADGFSITASGRGALGFGLAITANIEALADNSFQLGQGANVVANSMQVGTGWSSRAGGATASRKEPVVLGATDVTFAVTSSFAEVTGDAGGNTIATITGGYEGMRLLLLFIDALVTVTDDNTHAADTVDLSGVFTSADDSVLELVHDGTSWYEVSRSIN